MHSRGFRTSDLQRNVMGQSTVRVPLNFNKNGYYSSLFTKHKLPRHQSSEHTREGVCKNTRLDYKGHLGRKKLR